jgi:hypothetical protein
MVTPQARFTRACGRSRSSSLGGDNFVTFGLFWMSALIYFMVLIIAGWQVLALRHKKCSGGQIPRRPASGADGQAFQRLPSADPAGQLLPIDQGSRTSPKLDQADFPARNCPARVTAPMAPSRVSRRGRAIVVPLAGH